MASEFLSGLSQGLDRITANSLQEARQAVSQRESLEAANLANDFRAEMEEELIESENNYDYSGNYAENKLQRFDEKQNEFLTNIKSERVRNHLQKNLEQYKGNYNAHNLKFEIEAERGHQKNLARQNQSARIARYQANPSDGVYQSEILGIQNEYAGFDPSVRETYIQSQTSDFNTSVINTLANKIQTQFVEGKIATPEEYKRLIETQVISKINNPKFFLSPASRNSLFLSYEAKTREVSESLKKANTAALLGQSSSYLDLYSSGQTEKDLLFEEQGLKAGTFTQEDLDVADLTNSVSGAIVNGNLDLARNSASDLQQQYQNAIGRDDFKSAEGIKKQLDAVNGAIAKKQTAMVKNLPDAMASNMSLQNALDGGNTEAYANELWRLGSSMIPETDFKLLKSGQVQQYANILNNASPEQVQGAIQNLKQEWDFHITGTPNNKRAFDYVKSQIAGTKGLSLKARGMFLYGDDPVYGARFINALKAEHGTAVTTADEFKKSELNASISKELKGYRKALATTSDVIFDQDNVIIFHEQLIEETAKGLVQNGDAIPKDAVKMATEMTIGSRYDIINSTGGSSHLLDKTFEGSQKYRDFIENTRAQKSFLSSTLGAMQQKVDIKTLPETSLTPNETKQYEQWVKENNIPTGGYYDMQGFFKNEVLKGKASSQMGVDPYDQALHFTDKYKLPGHPTFSMQSQYWKEGMPKRDWVGAYYIDFDNANVIKDTTTEQTQGPTNLTELKQYIAKNYQNIPALKNKTQAENFVNQLKVAPAQQTLTNMLPEPGQMVSGLYGTEVGLPLNVIQNTGIFVPVESGSKLRLYVTYDLGGPGEGVRPLLLKDGSTYDVNPNDIELGRMDKFLKPTIADQDIRGGGRL